MRHPAEKLMMMEFLSLLIAFIFGLFAIFFKQILFLLFGGYFLCFSLFCDGLLLSQRRDPQSVGKQWLRAGVLFFLITLFLFL